MLPSFLKKKNSLNIATNILCLFAQEVLLFLLIFLQSITYFNIDNHSNELLENTYACF